MCLTLAVFCNFTKLTRCVFSLNNNSYKRSVKQKYVFFKLYIVFTVHFPFNVSQPTKCTYLDTITYSYQIPLHTFQSTTDHHQGATNYNYYTPTSSVHCRVQSDHCSLVVCRVQSDHCSLVVRCVMLLNGYMFNIVRCKTLYSSLER